MEALAEDARQPQDDPLLEAARRRSVRAGVLAGVLLVLLATLIVLTDVAWSAISTMFP